MIKPNEASGSFSSSSTSDTLAESSKDSLTTLFSTLFADTRADGRDLKENNHLPLTLAAVADHIPETSPKNNFSRHETEKKWCDIQRTSAIPESSSVCSENDTSLPLSTETVVSDRNKAPSSCSQVPVPILTSRTDDATADEEERNKKLIDASTLRRVCSSSRIPVSTTKRVLNKESQTRNLLFPSTTRSCLQRLVPATNVRESTHKCPPGNTINTSKKYIHIKSKVAAYIHRPAKHESAANKTTMTTTTPPRMRTRTRTIISNTTRSMSPNESCSCSSSSSSNSRNEDAYASASGDGIKRPSSRTSLETTSHTCGCETKMPSTDFSVDPDKLENSDDSTRRIIRKHVELAFEHNRRKLEKERIIAGHHRDIAKQHQLVLEHGEKAHDCLQKAMILLLDKQ